MMEWISFWQNRISNLYVLFFLLLFLKLRYKKWISGGIVLLCFALCSIFNFFGVWYKLDGLEFLIITISQTIFLQGSAFLLDQYRDFRTVFTGFTGAVYIYTGNICGTLIGMVTKSGIFAIVVEIILHTLILLTLAKFLRASYMQEQEERAGGWFFLCFLPSFLFLAFYTLVSYPSSIVDTPRNAAAVLLMQLVTLVAYVIVFRLLVEQRLENELVRNSDLLATGVRGLIQEINMMKEAEEKTAILRHDMRHNIQIMSSYLRTGEYDKLEQAFDHISRQIEESRREKYCDNIVVNSIVSYYAGQAKEKKIEFSASLMLASYFHADEMEFTSVLSNLLENAINAAEKSVPETERRIGIYANETKGRIILEVSNTFSGECTISQETGLPVTSRGEGHGYGMRSIAAFAEKYHAVFDYSVEGAMFIVRLLV